MQLNINSNAVVAHTNRLESMHRSALPNAIRNTLNDVAMDVKKNTMPTETGKQFKKRTPNFFKANSRVEFAKGWNVNSMKSTIGFIEGGLKGGNNYAVKDLEQQEDGGVIGGKSLIPLNTARSGNSYNKNVKSNVRLTNIQKIVNARSQKGKTKGEKFVNAVLKAGVGGYVLGSTKKGENIVWKVNALKSELKTKSFKPKLTPLYDYVKNRKVKVKKTNFMHKASLKSANYMEHMFINNANKQFERLRK